MILQFVSVQGEDVILRWDEDSERSLEELASKAKQGDNENSLILDYYTFV